MTRKSWKKIGKIGKPHGLKGSFYLAGRTQVLEPVFTEVLVGERPESSRSCKISAQRDHSNRTILTLDLFSDRTSLEPMVGQWIWAPDDIYERPIDSLRDRPCEDVNGEAMGTITDIFNHGASDILEITSMQHGVIEIPFADVYMDTELPLTSPVLKLKVSMDTFEGLWS